MDLRVYHSTLVSCGLTVNSSHVTFDENGVSCELSQEDFDTLTSIPAFWALEEWEQHLAQVELAVFGSQLETTATETAAAVVDALGEGEALPPEGEAPEEEVPEHDPDASLYDQFIATSDRAEFYVNLPLIERLDLASNPRLTEHEAEFLFAAEDASKKSKRCLSALDRRLVLLRRSQTAEKVTAAMIQTNFPRVEEQ